MASLVDDWLTYLTNTRGLSAATVASYRQDLASWMSYLDERDRDLLTADADAVRGYLAFLAGRRLSASTVNRHLSSLRGFYRWLARREDGLENPFVGTKGLRTPRPLPSWLRYRDIEKMIDATGDDIWGIRDRLIFEMLYSTGCRVSELAGLNRRDVAMRGTGPMRIKVRGKGDKDRFVFLGETARSVLGDWLAHREAAPGADADGRRALFLDRKGHRLTTRGISWILEQYAGRLGIARKVTPHMFRHSFATHMLDGGAEIRTVQELLGHASLSTTQVYTHTGIDRIKQIYRDAHPHARRQNGGESA